MAVKRPYVLLKAAISLDGFIADSSGQRLILSNSSDAELVDALRAEYDAILVGASTVRSDDPRLLIRSEKYRQLRRQRGLPPDPVKVTLTRTGDLDPQRAFFLTGQGEKIVYCSNTCSENVQERLGRLATIVPVDEEEVPVRFILNHLHLHGVRNLLVEGGGKTNAMFLMSGLVDEMRVAIAPMLLGAKGRDRLADLNGAVFGRMRLRTVEQVGDMAVAWYVPTSYMAE